MATQPKKIDIKFTTTELEFLHTFTGAAMMNPEIKESWGFDLEKKLQLQNKLAYLLLESRKSEKK